MGEGRLKKPARFGGEWEMRRLGDLARIATGTRNNQDKRHDGRYPFFVRSSFVERIDSFAYDCEAILIPGEGRIGEIFHYVHGRFDVHQRVYAITDFRSSVYARFLCYYMAEFFGAHALKNTVKATVDSLRQPTFLAFQIPLPPLPEQRAIAAILSDVDELIGSLEALIAKKRAIKQAAMQELLTGRTRLPGFGEEWEMRRLGDLGTFSKGRGIKRTDLSKTGVGCVRYGELYTRYENYVSKPVSKVPQDIADTALPIRRGDLMFAASGETADEIGICVAYVGSEPAYAGGDIIVLRASGQDAAYVAHLLNAPVAARQRTRMAQGDAVVHIRADHLAAIEIPLPPLPEQRAIATILSDIDAEIAALERRLDKTRAIKQGMMQQLLTGSIRLPIPDDDTEDDHAHDA